MSTQGIRTTALVAVFWAAIGSLLSALLGGSYGVAALSVIGLIGSVVAYGAAEKNDEQLEKKSERLRVVLCDIAAKAYSEDVLDDDQYALIERVMPGTAYMFTPLPEHLRRRTNG